MSRAFTEKRLIIASHNQGKCREIAAYLTPYAIEILSASDLNLPEPDETGTSYQANAILKAKAAAQAATNAATNAAQAAGIPALADDSGFEIGALAGKPGIYSARLAGADKNFTRASAQLYNDLSAAKASDFSCRFVCALALCWQDGFCISAEGHIDGTFIWPPRGEQGFGYDPVFQPKGYDKTFAEFDPAWKHAHSHRAKAFAKLIAQCFQNAHK